MTKEKPTRVADDVVVSLEYKLTVDGDLLDYTEEGETLDYLHGHDNIIPGLESRLTGMNVGESREVSVPPEDGYGLYDEEAVHYIAKLDIPGEVPLEEGVEIQVRDEDGDLTSAWISEILADEVKLDFNHPLSGDTLEFSVKIVGLRAPSAEELAHGHVHGEHGHDH